MTAQDDEKRYEHEDRAKAGNSSWTAEAIRALGAITDLQTLAGIFGCSGWSSRKMARTGEWERQGIKIFRIGAHYRVGVQSVLDVLGFSSGDLAPPEQARRRLGPPAERHGQRGHPGIRSGSRRGRAMNRSTGNGQAGGRTAPHGPAGVPSRISAPLRWRAAGVAAFTAYLRRHCRSGDPARNADACAATARRVGIAMSGPDAARSRGKPGWPRRCTTSQTPRTRQYERGPVSSPCGRRSTSPTSSRTSCGFSESRLNGSAVTGREVSQNRTMMPGRISRTRR